MPQIWTGEARLASLKGPERQAARAVTGADRQRPARAPRLGRREDTMAATQHHGRRSHTPTSAPNLEISPAKVWFFIQKAREFDVKDVVTDEGSGSNAADDGNLSVLEDHGDDPTYTELRMFINA